MSLLDELFGVRLMIAVPAAARRVRSCLPHGLPAIFNVTIAEQHIRNSNVRVLTIRPMGVLWSFMGFSNVYQIFTGIGEALGSLLIVFRRTTTLGALLLCGVLANVALLNYTFDVPVKLFSTNLLLMAVFLAAPDAKRLFDVLVRNRPAAPRPCAAAPAFGPAGSRP